MNNQYNICVIDDDNIYQYTISKTIKAYNLAKDILVFSDGEEALDFFIRNLDHSENLPDIVLLDINMPIMDGFQFMEEYIKIKPKVGKKILIYMVSSSVDSKDIERAKRISGVSDYIIKPIKPGELILIINSFQNDMNEL
ncbi:response regulator [Ulvibacter litoralis]|uniref:Response regulator receiver domain-containing protein n=1 Tax=Ulvibacter litoralis TaxID=227084 RepID=A0A1G7GZX0_9FLAO|nr:response regulator [Ulvibacter litoralis]GHC59481.1 response regulator [Ulvibacter litoralis]SDE93613.1 Response regulator receiver domain-containing protein [Ulvibacter litoralis]